MKYSECTKDYGIVGKEQYEELVRLQAAALRTGTPDELQTVYSEKINNLLAPAWDQLEGVALSPTSLLRYKDCEARAIAVRERKWVEPQTTAMLVGSYLHKHFEGADALRAFETANHDALFTQKGGLRSDFSDVSSWHQALCRGVYGCKPRGIAEVKLACDIPEHPECSVRTIVDIIDFAGRKAYEVKTVANMFSGAWVEEVGADGIKRNVKRPFFIANNYLQQMSFVYKILKLLFGSSFSYSMLAVAKEKTPAVFEFRLPSDVAVDTNPFLKQEKRMLEDAYDEMDALYERAVELSRTPDKPIYCGVCDYCLSKLSTTGRVTSFSEFMHQYKL